MPKTRSSARAHGRGGQGGRWRGGPRSLPATNGLSTSTSGEGDGAESGGIPSTLRQDYPHFLDIIRQEVRLQLASLAPAPLPPPTSHSTEVPLVPPFLPPPVFSMALAPPTVVSSSGVPFSLGVLPPASSMLAVPIFSGASPHLVASGHRGRNEIKVGGG